jgi:hypothetical protein
LQIAASNQDYKRLNEKKSQEKGVKPADVNEQKALLKNERD